MWHYGGTPKTIFNALPFYWAKISKCPVCGSNSGRLIRKGSKLTIQGFIISYDSFENVKPKQRFFKYLCMAAKVPRAVQLARAATRDGKCVIIGLQSTGKCQVNRNIDTYL